MKINLLAQIVDYLLMNSSFQDDLSLYHGKMGCALFFAHYSRYANKSYYAEFACEIVDEICEDLNDRVPIGFASGLCGIAWGIEHLVQEKFVKGDTGTILEDLNLKIMEHDPNRIQNRSFEKGLKGIEYYIQVHVHSPYMKTKSIDDEYIYKLNSIIECENLYVNYDNALNFPIELLEKIHATNVIEGVEFSNCLLGLDGGLAGMGLKMIGI